MVEPFLPTRRIRYGDAFDTFGEMTFDDVAALIAADKPTRLQEYARNSPDFFGGNDVADATDIKAARELLTLALRAKDAVSGKALSPASLAEFGLVSNKPSEAALSFMQLASELEAAAAEVADELGPGGAEKLLGKRAFRRARSANPALVGETFSWGVPTGGYAEYLCEAIVFDVAYAEIIGTPSQWDCVWYREYEDGSSEEVEPDDADGLQIICALGYYEETSEGAAQCLSDLVDRLFTLHMWDVRTISSDGGQERRIIATGVSSLWWCAIDSLRDGRLGTCEVCGKPYVARGERGKPRKYCSTACRVWHKNHPGEKKANF